MTESFDFERQQQQQQKPANKTVNDKRIYYGMENGIIIVHVDVINTPDLLFHFCFN
jgi:hypothetical protein